MKKIFKFILNKLIDLILIIISLKIFQPIYDFLIHLSLKAKGYKNFGNLFLTGENHFLNTIKKYNIKLSIDIGANIGNYSEKLLKIIKSNVIAFEPDLSAYKNLKSLEKKYKKNFKSFNLALSDKDETLYFYSTGKKSQLSSLNKNISKLNYINKSKIKKKKN